MPILKNEADIVIPKRREEEFQVAYPSYMYESETFANRKYNRILKEFGILSDEAEDLDVYFGPTVIANDPQVVALFMERYKLQEGKGFEGGIRRYAYPDNFSNSQMFAIVKALNSGLRVMSVEVPFVYPKLQGDNEMIKLEDFQNKRRAQKWSILDELVLFIRYLKDSSSPKNALERVE